jgi:hypothetical protein
MNITELEKFKIEDAINFHDELNPLLFDENNKLKPNIKKQLEIITDDFIEFMGIPDLAVEDVIITGSNVAFTYTPHSDIDLHLLVDFAELPDSDVYKELFNAKKSLYNDTYDITIRDIPVELYVQDTAQAHTSLGEYSLMKDKFTRFPKKQRANLDEISTEHKFERLEELCLKGLKSKNIDQVNHVLDIIKRYRQAGLDQKGEFGPENLAFKAIRSKGYFQALFDLRNKLRGEQLSIEEELLRRTFEESIGVYNSKVNIAEGENGVEQLAKQFNMKNIDVAKYLDAAIKFEMQFSNKDKGEAYKEAVKNLSKDIEYYEKMVTFLSAVERLNRNAKDDVDVNDISKMMEKTEESLLPDKMTGDQMLSLLNQKHAWDEGMHVVELIHDVKNHNWVLIDNYPLAGLGSVPDKYDRIIDTDDDYAMRDSDLSKPIVIASDRKTVIDGNHRVHKAKKMGKTSLPAYFPMANEDIVGMMEESQVEYALYVNGKPQIKDVSKAKLEKLIQFLKKRGIEGPYDIKQLSTPARRPDMIGEASGYIPSEAQRNDPRFSYALTVDVHPDTMKKQAKAMGLGNIQRDGRPPLLRPGKKKNKNPKTDFGKGIY